MEPKERALRVIGETFGDRLKRGPNRAGGRDDGGALASVSPMTAEEVELIADVAERYSVPLSAVGAGTAFAPAPEGRGILIRFDLMRAVRFPEHAEPWVEAEPGASWLQLDDNLRARGGWGLAVYPTSAPRATVGGWVTQDGIGVGSFEYGWLSENVLSASVVLPGGERREVPGEDLRAVVTAEGMAAIVVGAKLRTRRADDVLFGATFGSAEDLLEAVANLAEARSPLWHLAFLNPTMARARGLAEHYTMFGAYPVERAGEAEDGLRDVLGSRHGRTLPAAEAHRVWGERFFPVAPSHPTPSPTRDLVHLAKLPEGLGEIESRSAHAAVQGTVARSGEVLLLAFDARDEGWAG